MADIVDIQDKLADTCHCGSVKFNLLKSGKIQCHGCDDIGETAVWLNVGNLPQCHNAIVGIMAATGDDFQMVIKVLIGLGVAKAKATGLDGEAYLASITD